MAGSKKVRADGQLSGLAGESFVAAELLKRSIQTSVTFGNAGAIDLLAHNLRAGEVFTVQVSSGQDASQAQLHPHRALRG